MKVVVVGSGGHARSVIEALRTAGDHDPVACTDPDPAGSSIDGIPVVGGDDRLPSLLAAGVTGACMGVGGVADNALRARLFDHAAALGFVLPPVVHGRAIVAGSATLAAGAQVLAGAIVGAGARLGENVIVNCGSIVEHDCVVGNHAHLATGCALAGQVTVHDGAHVGLAACVRQGVTVGARAVVGAGAVVVADVTAGHVVVGCPAATLRVSG